MKTNKLEIFSIYDLHNNQILRDDKSVDKEVQYYIESYQRGYRWDNRQIELLLEDLWDFYNKSINRQLKISEYYCLQPIVVKPKIVDEKFYWEVLDGQQRLTSLKILIKFLICYTERKFEHFYLVPEFDINYKTRVDSAVFIDSLADRYDGNLVYDNIDYYYMSQAFHYMGVWFSKLREDNDIQLSYIQGFLNLLMSNNKNENLIKVIWYEVNDDTDSYEIFTRLNIGKIKLTNSELIKALFLKRPTNYDSQSDEVLKEMSYDWNMLEQKLQNDEFWYFIYQKDKKNPITYANRIEYVFDLYCHRKRESKEDHTFYVMSDMLKECDTIVSRRIVWNKFKEYLQRLEGWFLDYKFYHIIGFLITVGESLNEIIKCSEGKHKNDFYEILKNELIHKYLPNDLYSIGELKYKSKEVFSTLLLFNIQTIISNDKSNYRFPFNLFKAQEWDIEHIKSKNDKLLSKHNEWQEWTVDIVEYFTNFNLTKINQKDIIIDNDNISRVFELDKINEEYTDENLKLNLIVLIKSYFEDNFIKVEMEKHFNFFKFYFNEDKDTLDRDSIANLTLLDRYTNRSYKNAFYPIKRKRIQNNGKYGIFTPVCTTNTFMKVYSKKLDNLSHWSDSDSESYVNEIIEVLKPYFTDGSN